MNHGRLNERLRDNCARVWDSLAHRVVSCLHILCSSCCRLANVTLIQLFCLELEMFAQHVKLLIATSILLRVHRGWNRVFVLWVSADKLELGVLSLVSCRLLALRCTPNDTTIIFVQKHLI